MSKLTFPMPKTEREVEKLGGERLVMLANHLGVKIKGLDYDEKCEAVWEEIESLPTINSMDDDEDGSPTPKEVGIKVGSRVRYHRERKGQLVKIRCKVVKLNNGGTMDLEDKAGNMYLGVTTTEVFKLVKTTDDEGNIKWVPDDTRPDRKKKKVVANNDDDDDEVVVVKKKKVIDDDDDEVVVVKKKKKVVVEDDDEENENPLVAVAKHIHRVEVKDLIPVLDMLSEDAIDAFMSCKAGNVRRTKGKAGTNGTITGTMLQMLREADEDNPVTKDEILEAVIEKFPGHPRTSLANTVSKIPWTLENVAGKKTGVEVSSRKMEGKGKGYWIEDGQIEDSVDNDDDD